MLQVIDIDRSEILSLVLELQCRYTRHAPWLPEKMLNRRHNPSEYPAEEADANEIPWRCKCKCHPATLPKLSKFNLLNMSRPVHSQINTIRECHAACRCNIVATTRVWPAWPAPMPFVASHDLSQESQRVASIVDDPVSGCEVKAGQGRSILLRSRQIVPSPQPPHLSPCNWYLRKISSCLPNISKQANQQQKGKKCREANGSQRIST